jgi:hypothetical protein
LIHLLKARGSCIASGRLNKIDYWDGQIDEYLQKKGKEDTQRIISAFVTFNTEEGYNEALRYIDNPSWLKKKEKDLLGSTLKMESAGEPGNIIWENKHIKGWVFYSKFITGFGAVSIMLLISFSIIVYLQIKSLHLDNEYPQIDCKELFLNYDRERIE